MSKKLEENTSSKNASLLLSGGIDSFCCAYILKKSNYNLEGLFFNYGQAAHHQEEISAKKIAAFLEIDLKVINIDFSKKFSAGEVTSRNLFLISAASLYTDFEHTLICIGIHKGTSYYDCSDSFTQALDSILSSSSNGRHMIHAPLLNLNKNEIIEYCKSQNLPLEISYSCETGAIQKCGNCLTCKDLINYGIM